MIEVPVTAYSSPMPGYCELTYVLETPVKGKTFVMVHTSDEPDVVGGFAFGLTLAVYDPDAGKTPVAVETEAAPAETEATPNETEAAPTETEAAPTETEKPAETEAAPSGNTGSNGWILWVVIGVVVVAAAVIVAVVLSKKKKYRKPRGKPFRRARPVRIR